MSDSIDDIGSTRKSDMANFVNGKNVSKSVSIVSGSKSFAHQPLTPITSVNQWKIGKRTGVQVASFLIKTIALETLRRFSRAKCPFIWTGVQALQVLCYPPLKWVQCWNPFGILIKGMQMLSRPLLVLSIVNAISDRSDCSNIVLDGTENSNSNGDSQVDSDSYSGSLSIQPNHDIRISEENPQGQPSTVWMCNFCEELEKQGLTLPERINKEELQRFYLAANGNLSSLLLSVKKTIRWRETYRILSGEELEMWSNLVFWHGLDVKHKPCLIVRLGVACSLSSNDRPRFVQAVVSQVEHGVLYLVDRENPQITVIVDCQGLSPLKIPMQIMRHCCNLLQDHFPNVLGCLIVIRLPPVVRVITQTFIQVLKPVTKQKLRIAGVTYHKVLSEHLQTLPSYLGGLCTCTRCDKLNTGIMRQSLDSHTSNRESVANIVNAENNFPLVEPTYQYDMITDGNFSRTLRAAVVGILIIWVLIAFIEGIYNPDSRPSITLAM